MTVFLRIQTTTSTTQDPEIYSTALHNYIKVKVLRVIQARPLSWALHPQDPGTVSPRPVLFLQCRDTSQSSPRGLLPTYRCPLCQHLLATGHWSSGELTFPMASRDSAPCHHPSTPTHR